MLIACVLNSVVQISHCIQGMSVTFSRQLACRRRLSVLNFLSRRFSNQGSEQDRIHIRNAQAAEIFRSSYFQSKNQEMHIPVEDLDQLVAKERVRPSILLGAFELTGFGLGLVTRFAPKSVASVVSQAIDDATVQQFNDSIRKMHADLDGESNIDVKETLKYHRDLRGEDECESSSEENENSMLGKVKLPLTQLLYHGLKMTEKY